MKLFLTFVQTRATCILHNCYRAPFLANLLLKVCFLEIYLLIEGAAPLSEVCLGHLLVDGYMSLQMLSLIETQEKWEIV